jgi:predicted flap endonuclease-1-like 5' DNA nuclease
VLFLIGEIVLYLVIAALLGLVLGWLLGRMGRKPADEASIELTDRLAEREAEIDRLTAELAPYQADDLKLINGIGPVFERTLNSMGHTTYAQVAKWTRDDIRDVAAEIDLFPDRIIRDQWVEQAAALQHAKSEDLSDESAAEEPTADEVD